VVRALTRAGVPVMGHLGLTPQTAGQLGGIQGPGPGSGVGTEVVAGCEVPVAAGVFAIVLECVPGVLAGIVTRRGSGADHRYRRRSRVRRPGPGGQRHAGPYRAADPFLCQEIRRSGPQVREAADRLPGRGGARAAIRPPSIPSAPRLALCWERFHAHHSLPSVKELIGVTKGDVNKLTHGNVGRNAKRFRRKGFNHLPRGIGNRCRVPPYATPRFNPQIL
jgi:hypothetical protein